MPRLTLVTDESESADPTAETVEAALARLSAEREAYALLGEGPAESVQATRSAGTVALERQAGGARWVWSGGEPTAAELRGVFLRYLRGDESWKAEERWRLFDDEQAARADRQAVLARLSAAPLYVAASGDGSLWSASDGQSTAVLAFASEQAAREACPGARIDALAAPELLRRFLAAPHATLFVESGSDWLSVSRDEAGALLALVR